MLTRIRQLIARLAGRGERPAPPPAPAWVPATPAQQSRGMLGLRGLEGAEPRRHEQLREFYQQSRAALPDPAARLGAGITGAELLTYGELACVEDVLDAILEREGRPLHHSPHRLLVYSLHLMLPLPEGVRFFDEPEAAAAWVRANLTRMRWDEEGGRFVLAPEERESNG